MSPLLRPPRLLGRWSLALPFLYMGVITFLSHQPADPDLETPFGFSLADLDPELGNLLHIPLYWILGSLWCLYFEGRGFRGARAAVVVTLLCGSFGVLDEFHQSFVPGRFPSAVDVALDALGGALAAVTWPCVARVAGIRRPAGGHTVP